MSLDRVRAWIRAWWRRNVIDEDPRATPDPMLERYNRFLHDLAADRPTSRVSS